MSTATLESCQPQARYNEDVVEEQRKSDPTWIAGICPSRVAVTIEYPDSGFLRSKFVTVADHRQSEALLCGAGMREECRHRPRAGGLGRSWRTLPAGLNQQASSRADLPLSLGRLTGSSLRTIRPETFGDEAARSSTRP